MGRDIRIKPSASLIQFSGSAGNLEASIELDTFGRLVLSSSQVIFGPGDNDIYFGDGTSSVNIIFDKNATLKSELGSGAEITLGSGDTIINISGSDILITGSNLIIGPFSSSFAQINSGSITGSFNASFITASLINANNINVDNLIVDNFTSSYVALDPNGAVYFNTPSGSGINKGGSIYLDNQGNLVIDSTSGSVYLAKNVNDIYIGDGTSSADIVFDFDGAIRGETGKNVFLTLGSSTTYLTLTGSTLNLGPFTASYAQINSGNITASVVSSSILIGNSLYVTSSISGSTIQTNTASFGLISGSRLNLNNNSGIFFTGSTITPGASIQLNNFGDLVLNAVSGNVIFGNGSNDIYVGDGVSPASLIFDFNGRITGTPGTNLTLGTGSSSIEVTGSSITFQKGGGNVVISGSLIASSSIISPTSSGTPSFTGTDGQFVFGTDGGNHYIYVWMSGTWRSSSLS
jgi:hypothetical protein